MAPNRVVILRHGEKPGDPAAPDDPADPNLSPAGMQRANMLMTLIPSKFGNLNFLPRRRIPTRAIVRWKHCSPSQTSSSFQPTNSFRHTQMKATRGGRLRPLEETTLKEAAPMLSGPCYPRCYPGRTYSYKCSLGAARMSMRCRALAWRRAAELHEAEQEAMHEIVKWRGALAPSAGP
jgi:hypothetical protein